MNSASFWSLENLTGRWHPTIGDPTFVGWFTVGSYFTCAMMAFWAALTNKKTDRGSFLFWSMISILMILLGINKQLDLQSLLTEVGRQIARHQGWMDQRRVVQFWFVVFFGTTAIISFLSFIFIMRDLFKRFMLSFIGLFFLISFIIIRAASFHHFDKILQLTLLDFKMNWLFELTGIYTIFAAGIMDILRLKHSSKK
jgi:hypothetical protein